MSYRAGDAARRARERYELKQAAAEFYRKLSVTERLEEALNSTFCLGPEDVYGHLANYFAQFSKPPTICQIRGRKVLDGTGEPTVEAEVFCTVKNMDKRICSSVISAASEHPKASKGPEQESNHSADIAIQWLNDLSPKLRGMSPDEQHKIDQLLSDFYQPKIEEEKERRQMEREASPMPLQPEPSPVTSPAPGKKKGSGKGKKAAVVEKPIPPEETPEAVVPGSPAIGALSLAVAKASSVLSKTPLYLHIRALRNEKLPTEFFMPTPMISILSCGTSSPGKLNLMKEVLVIPQTGLTVQQSLDMALMLQNQIVKQINAASKTGPAIKNVSPLGCMLIGGDRIEQPLDLICEACQHVGLELGTNLYLAINCAAHELMDYNKGKYEVLSGTFKSPDEMIDLYVDLINRQPAILALLDPLRKEDTVQWESLAKALGSKCYLFADAASKPICKLLESGSMNSPPCSGTVIKHTNEITISQLLGVFKLIEGENRVAVLGCPYKESVGDSTADLAVGLGARFVKLGGLLRGERTTKYNRLLAIEDELTQAGALGFWTKNEFPVLCEVQNQPGPQETPETQ
ncbi:hypothetical protein XENTR_v10017583 [Xenopus tropicalis]|nr:hypothetical protein XENTR_v10017583 [Xenopus tropicalis]